MMASSTRELLEAHPEAWDSAVSPQFMKSCKAGKITTNQFGFWLVQKHSVSVRFADFRSSLKFKATLPGIDRLVGSEDAQEECVWLKAQAEERSFCLPSIVHPGCQPYHNFLEEVADQPYAVHAVTLWAIERANQQAWSIHMPLAQPYQAFAEQRYGNENFELYVARLALVADAALRAANIQDKQEAEAAFERVCELEANFWQMAYSAP